MKTNKQEKTEILLSENNLLRKLLSDEKYKNNGLIGEINNLKSEINAKEEENLFFKRTE